MKSETLRNWMKSAGLSRRDLADKCDVSERTVEGWFMREELPRSVGLLVGYIMREAAGKMSLTLSVDEMGRLLKKMEADGFENLSEYIAHLIRKEIARRPSEK